MNAVRKPALNKFFKYIYLQYTRICRYHAPDMHELPIANTLMMHMIANLTFF